MKYKAVSGSLKQEISTKGDFPGDLKADNKNSFYLGRHLIRNGDRPQSYSRSPDPMIEFYEMHKDIFDSFGVNVSNSIVINGCFKSNKETLQRTMIPETDSIFAGLPSMNLIRMKSEAIKTAIRKLKIVKLDKCIKSDLITSSFNMKSFPGFTYREYFNCKNKEEALPIALEVANKRWDNIISSSSKKRTVVRKELYPSSFTVGARNKREYDYVNGEEVTSRAVHMPEFHVEICDAPWIEQISEYIKFIQRGSIYIGNSSKKSHRLYKDLKDSKDVIEGDVRRFDSSLFITDIIIAVAIARLYYDLDDFQIDNHFVAMFDSIGIKDYYTPGGFIYRMIHGIPSGVKSTTLFGSLINLVNLIHCNQDANQKRTKYIVGGDDFLISSEESVSDLDLERFKNRGDEIGYTFKILKKKNINARNFEDRPVFYKYTLDKGEPVITTSVLLERVFMPWSRKYKNNYEILIYLEDLMPSLCSPRSNMFLFYKFYQIMYFYVTKNMIPIEEVYQRHLSKYKKVMSGQYLFKFNTESFSTPIYNYFSLRVSISTENIFKVFKTKYEIKSSLCFPSKSEKIG